MDHSRAKKAEEFSDPKQRSPSSVAPTSDSFVNVACKFVKMTGRAARVSSTVFRRLFMHAHGPKNHLGNSERNPYVSVQLMVESSTIAMVTYDSYRYESIEYIYFFFVPYTCIRIHNTYVPTYVRPTKGRQAQSYKFQVSNPVA